LPLSRTPGKRAKSSASGNSRAPALARFFAIYNLFGLMSVALRENSIDIATARTTACAKVNLTLEVLKRRGDGFHELRSLAVGVDLRDELRCAAHDEARVDLACSDRSLEGPHNLASRAAHELAQQAGITPSLRIELRKSIPVGGGMGGGSSDAASALRLCNHLWQTGLEVAALAEVGARVGSDVPLFFFLPAAVMTGRGECVQRVTMRWNGFVLLVFIGEPISTAAVYEEWRPADGAQLPAADIESVLSARGAAELSAALSNHLQPAVFRVCPRLKNTHEQLERAGFGPLTVSGAGSAMYGLFDDEDEAWRTACEIERQHPDLTTCVVGAPAGPGCIEKEQ